MDSPLPCRGGGGGACAWGRGEEMCTRVEVHSDRGGRGEAEVREGRTGEELRGGGKGTVSQLGDKKRQRRREGRGVEGVQIVGER